MKKKQYAWSIDEENFRYDSLEELLADDDEVLEGHTVHVGEVEKPSSEYLISVEDITDTMAERAWEICGEWTPDDFPDVSKEAKKLLRNYLDRWIKKHVPITFYSVKNVKEYVVTAEDLFEVR